MLRSTLNLVYFSLWVTHWLYIPDISCGPFYVWNDEIDPAHDVHNVGVTSRKVSVETKQMWEGSIKGGSLIERGMKNTTRDRLKIDFTLVLHSPAGSWSKCIFREFWYFIYDSFKICSCSLENRSTHFGTDFHYRTGILITIQRTASHRSEWKNNQWDSDNN